MAVPGICPIVLLKGLPQAFRRNIPADSSMTKT